MKEDLLSTQLMKELQSGKYRNSYLVYNRKSTDEANNQKNSISYQRSENTRFAKSTHLPIAQVTLSGFCTNGLITEKHSGFKEDAEFSFSADGKVQYSVDRPKFLQMVQLVNAGYFKGIVCLCWDRISRNKGDETIVRKLLKQGIDIRFSWATYDKSSSGELHMDIDGMFAVHHSRVTSEKVTVSTKNSREKGKCTYRAPIGYLNEGTMDYKPIDPERGPVIAEMFKLYATGEWSLSDLARHATQQGFTTVPMRSRRTRAEMLADEDEEEPAEREKICKPIDENGVSRILTSHFYTGKVLGPDGVYIKSNSHEALVDDDTFNQVQSLLGKKKVSVHYTEKLDHPLRGVVRCGYCQRVYTPYTKKGILYFNARCIKGCSNKMKNCNLDFITGKIRGLISNLYFTDDELI
jgi:DNA invertase Pin-like site-specific DNA recombinase